MTDHYENLFKEDLIHSYERFDELTLILSPRTLVRSLTMLKEKENFDQLIDICGVDYPHHVQRFEIVYHLLNMRSNQRLRIKILTEGNEPVPSIISVFPNANWYEREVWDLYGVTFEDHPDLRRLLTDYNFEGHPLRKDFPLTGYTEVHYSEEDKRVVYDTVHLPQEYRSFDFLSPWEGAIKPFQDPSTTSLTSSEVSES